MRQGIRRPQIYTVPQSTKTITILRENDDHNFRGMLVVKQSRMNRITRLSQGMACGPDTLGLRLAPSSRARKAPLIDASTSLQSNPEQLLERTNRAKARWLKRIMYESSANSTEKCFAYSVADHLNCVTLDCWPSQSRLAKLLGFDSVKTIKRAAQGLEQLGVLTIKSQRRNRCRYAPVFLEGDEDKIVKKAGLAGPPAPDRNVTESYLNNLLKPSPPTTAADQGSEPGRSVFHGYNYNPRQRGALELEVAELLGGDGFEVLARLAELDPPAVDRLCRAFAVGALGDRELAAARLAVQQWT